MKVSILSYNWIRCISNARNAVMSDLICWIMTRNIWVKHDVYHAWQTCTSVTWTHCITSSSASWQLRCSRSPCVNRKESSRRFILLTFAPEQVFFNVHYDTMGLYGSFWKCCWLANNVQFIFWPAEGDNAQHFNSASLKCKASFSSVSLAQKFSETFDYHIYVSM